MKFGCDLKTDKMPAEPLCGNRRGAASRERVEHHLAFFCRKFDEKFDEFQRLLRFVNFVFALLETISQEIGRIRAMNLTRF